MDSFLSFFSRSDFSPHGFCLAWEPSVFWTHVIADSIIGLSYFSIPAVIGIFALRRRHGRGENVLIMFSVFIVTCGITHFFGVWTLWFADYGAEAVAKGFNAVASAITAVMLWLLLPKALKIPSAEELEYEIRQKEMAQQDLISLNHELEERVLKRTRELESLNSKLNEARHKAEEASNSKSRFLASMSHEMRTPLNAIIGFSDYLISFSENLSAKQKEYVNDIHRSGQNLLRLMSDLLEMSTIEQGKVTLTERAVDAYSIIGGIHNELNTLFEESDRVLHLANDIPEDTITQTDRMRVQQIIKNFVTNAIKYNRPGGNVFVHAMVDAEKGQFVFSVTDEGEGISAEDLDKIFIPFERLQSHVHAIDGTGIGLAISRFLANELGGEIIVYSPPEQGTTFTLTLPIKMA